MNIEIRPWDHGERLEVSACACGAQLSMSDRMLEELDRTAEDCDGHGSRLSTVHLSDKTANILSSLRYSARSYTITYYKAVIPSTRPDTNKVVSTNAMLMLYACWPSIFHNTNFTLIQKAYHKLWIALSTIICLINAKTCSWSAVFASIIQSVTFDPLQVICIFWLTTTKSIKEKSKNSE